MCFVFLFTHLSIGVQWLSWDAFVELSLLPEVYLFRFCTFLHTSKQNPQLHVWFLHDIHLVMFHWAEVPQYSLSQSGSFSQPFVLTTLLHLCFHFFGWKNPHKRFVSAHHTVQFSPGFSPSCTTVAFGVVHTTWIREKDSPFRGLTDWDTVRVGNRWFGLVWLRRHFMHNCIIALSFYDCVTLHFPGVCV